MIMFVADLFASLGPSSVCFILTFDPSVAFNHHQLLRYQIINRFFSYSVRTADFYFKNNGRTRRNEERHYAARELRDALVCAKGKLLCCTCVTNEAAIFPWLCCWLLR